MERDVPFQCFIEPHIADIGPLGSWECLIQNALGKDSGYFYKYPSFLILLKDLLLQNTPSL